jgi:hypothetical protein
MPSPQPQLKQQTRSFDGMRRLIATTVRGEAITGLPTRLFAVVMECFQTVKAFTTGTVN